MKFKTHKEETNSPIDIIEIATELVSEDSKPSNESKSDKKLDNLYYDRIASTLDFLETALDLLKSDLKSILKSSNESDD